MSDERSASHKPVLSTYLCLWKNRPSLLAFTWTFKSHLSEMFRQQPDEHFNSLSQCLSHWIIVNFTFDRNKTKFHLSQQKNRRRATSVFDSVRTFLTSCWTLTHIQPTHYISLNVNLLTAALWLSSVPSMFVLSPRVLNSESLMMRTPWIKPKHTSVNMISSKLVSVPINSVYLWISQIRQNKLST